MAKICSVAPVNLTSHHTVKVLVMGTHGIRARPRMFLN